MVVLLVVVLLLVVVVLLLVGLLVETNGVRELACNLCVNEI